MPSEKPQRNVLVLTDVLGGGTGNHLLSMIRYADKSRWRLNIMTQVPPTSRESPDVPVIVTPPPHRLSVYPFSQALRLHWIRQYLHLDKPDLIHAYFFWSIIYGRILKLLGAARYLVENREDEGFNWGRHEYALLRLTRFVPDRVICVSEAVRRVVLNKEKLDPARTTVIYNGIETVQGLDVDKSATYRELGLTESNPVVGMVANLNRAVKGVSCFLSAIPDIVEAVPTARFLILGRGKEEQALKQEAAALGIEPHVIFAGYRKDIQRFYAIMDVSVLTSFSEGLSISLLESMAHGLPVVATCVGGNPELVEDGRTGFLVPPRNVEAFSARVIELLQNPHMRTRMGEAGCRRVRQHFRICNAWEYYSRVYSELLD